MKKCAVDYRYHDFFEYFGNTEIKRTREKAGAVISRDWLTFDSVEEAMAFFNGQCGEFGKPDMVSTPAWMIQEMTSP